ncbi:uncharacterized protein TNCV_4527681 [Trichonephila clavipes]|nr:uncharacterized protein TNCV_4527681 [Trichonephila clavipes]
MLNSCFAWRPKEITDFVQSIPGFQECDDETWMACEADDCGFQMLNNNEILTSMQEESDPVGDETDEDEDNNNDSSKGPSNADAFSALQTAMDSTNNNQSAILLNYCCSRESET